MKSKIKEKFCWFQAMNFDSVYLIQYYYPLSKYIPIVKYKASKNTEVTKSTQSVQGVILMRKGLLNSRKLIHLMEVYRKDLVLKYFINNCKNGVVNNPLKFKLATH